MEVKEIIKEYLEKNGYDGLFLPGNCACKKNDLMPCDVNFSECIPGYLYKCDCGARMNKYAVSTVWKKEIIGGFNIWNSLEVLLAETPKEAAGKHILSKIEEIKEHSLLLKPNILLIEENITQKEIEKAVEEAGSEIFGKNADKSRT